MLRVVALEKQSKKISFRWLITHETFSQYKLTPGTLRHLSFTLWLWTRLAAGLGSLHWKPQWGKLTNNREDSQVLGGTSGLSSQCRWKHQKGSQWKKRRKFTQTYMESLEPLLISGETLNSPSRTCGLPGCFGSTVLHMNTLYVQFVLPMLYLLLGLGSTDKKQQQQKKSEPIC